MRLVFALCGMAVAFATLAFMLIIVDGYDFLYLCISGVACLVSTFFWCLMLYDAIKGGIYG